MRRIAQKGTILEDTLIFVASLLLAPLAALKAADAPVPSPVKTGVILVNHVGFPPNAPKHCVIPSPPENEFTIHRLKDTEWAQVFTSTLTEGGPELEPGWVGDFSSLKEDGIYQVRCGSLRSRCFTVHAGVYDVPMRVMFNYFTWTRCGDTTKGWAGPCHLDDGKLAPTGEHRDFSGGYHQSSDLRKWAALEILGPLGLVEFARQQSPHWDNGSIAEEVRWGCDYFQKLVRDDGGMFDSVFIPLGWGPRDFYPSDPPAPALWNNIRLQAMAAAYFQSRDPDYAAKCKETSERVWRYMTSEKRPKGKYEIPAYPPRGHRTFNEWFAGYYENSALDWAQRLCAALALHRLSGDVSLLEDAVRSAAKLVALQTAETGAEGDAGGCFWEGPESDGLAENRFLSTGASIQIGLCELLSAAPTHPDSTRWRRAVERMAEQHLHTASRNPWGLMATKWASEPKPVKRVQGARRDGLFDGGCLGSRTPGGPQLFAAYLHRHALYHQEIMGMALFMRRAAAITGREEYRVIAQRQLDWVMGCNPFDASAIEGVGYNQPQRGLFGEFFPPTPQIPGAVSIGLAAYSFDPKHYGSANEYDLPAAGSVLWLTAEQAKQP